MESTCILLGRPGNFTKNLFMMTIPISSLLASKEKRPHFYLFHPKKSVRTENK